MSYRNEDSARKATPGEGGCGFAAPTVSPMVAAAKKSAPFGGKARMPLSC